MKYVVMYEEKRTKKIKLYEVFDNLLEATDQCDSCIDEIKFYNFNRKYWVEEMTEEEFEEFKKEIQN